MIILDDNAARNRRDVDTPPNLTMPLNQLWEGASSLLPANHETIVGGVLSVAAFQEVLQLRAQVHAFSDPPRVPHTNDVKAIQEEPRPVHCETGCVGIQHRCHPANVLEKIKVETILDNQSAILKTCKQKSGRRVFHRRYI